MKNFIQRVFFPSYKRTISILVILILVLSVPITLRLVGQQQDLRQRAAEVCLTEDGSCGALSCAERSNKSICETGPDFCFWYGGGPGENARCVDNSGNMNSSNICNGGHCYADQNYCVENRCTATAPATCVNSTCSNGLGPCRTNSDCGGVDPVSSGPKTCVNSTCSNGLGPCRTNSDCGGVDPVSSGPKTCVNSTCSNGLGPCRTNSDCGGVDPVSSGGTTTTTPTELARPSVSGQGYTSGCNSVTLTWGAVPGATQYIIRQYNQAGVAESAFDKSYLATGTSYTVTDLISNPLTAYFFNIYATNGSTTSKASSILAATGACTTASNPPTAPTGNQAADCQRFSQYCTVDLNAGSSSCNWGSISGSPACASTVRDFYTSCLKSSGNLDATVQSLCPSSQATTGNYTFSLTASLPGISSGGLGRNASPKKNSRTFSVALFAPNTQTKGLDGMIGSIQQANLVFNGSNNYTGQIQLVGVPAGSYFVKIKTDNSNWKLIPGVQTLTQGSTTTVPQVTLVTGDINNNNGLDVGDYSSMISCIKNTCDGNTRSLADLNDDSLVDEVDLNILYSGFSNRNGD